MIAHIMQALMVIILICFPLAINFNDITLDNHSFNSTAVVDTALIKHYSQTGSLPERLDAETLKKLGLDDKAVEGMEYKKIEDRKFVLTYANSKNEVKESIHSNTLLPLNTVSSSGKTEVEEEVKKFFINLDESPHQKIWVDVTLPNGTKDVVNEGERKEFPYNSFFETSFILDEGYVSMMEPNPKHGYLDRNTYIDFWDPVPQVYKLGMIVNSNVRPNDYIEYSYLDVNDKMVKGVIHPVSDYPNNLVRTVPYGTKWKYNVVGHSLSEGEYISPSERGIVTADTYVTIRRKGDEKNYTLSVADTTNQTVTVTVRDNRTTESTQLTNGQSGIFPADSRFWVNVKAMDGYYPGTPNLSSGSLTKDTMITVSDAETPENKKFKLSVDYTNNQTITVIVQDIADNKEYRLTDGESRYFTNGSTFKATIKATEGFKAGTLNYSSGIINKDLEITASHASKEDVHISGGPIYVNDEKFYLIYEASPKVVKDEAYIDRIVKQFEGIDFRPYNSKIEGHNIADDNKIASTNGKYTFSTEEAEYILITASCGNFNWIKPCVYAALIIETENKYTNFYLDGNRGWKNWSGLTALFLDYRVILKVKPQSFINVYNFNYASYPETASRRGPEVSLFTIRPLKSSEVTVLSSTHAKSPRAIPSKNTPVENLGFIDGLHYFYPEGKVEYYDLTK